MKLTGSKKLNALLDAMGIRSYEDVLFHLPRGYDSFVLTNKDALLHMEDKARVVVHGKVVGSPEYLRFSGRANYVRFFFNSLETGLEFRIVAWNRQYLASQIHDGDEFTIRASFDASRHCLNMISMKKGVLSEEELIQPIYSLPKDYPPHLFRALVKKAIDESEGKIQDWIPSFLRSKYRLLSKEDALKKCHFPLSERDIRDGLRVLKYEEALLFTLKNQIIRRANKLLTHSRERRFSHVALTQFVRSLPYSLTASQNVACREIVTDMEKKELMNRLLQGDVGTGKTLVSAIAIYVCYLRGQQSALMAPTDALARQHYQFLTSLFSATPIVVALLVGDIKKAERKHLLEDLSEGKIDVLVGTHALFSKDVAYIDLGLAIIDEQHKFGVNQRSLLAHKGDDADLLLMSATPIPRTLSMTLYGDLDVSTLHDFPFGKRDVTSLLVKPGAKKINKIISSFLEQHRPIFVVAPQIEENGSELSSVKSVFEAISQDFPDQAVLLHGQMDNGEKAKAIEEFQSKRKLILVATTVIEVGIDVKDAGLMVVYEAHRFSLSSLHQLRGRIGRDGEKAIFLMVSDGDEKEVEKLSVILSSEDGFEIAEADLKLRGPGTLAGIRQSGMPDFRFANLVNDFRVFEAARKDAFELLSNASTEAKDLIRFVSDSGVALLDS